MASDLGLARRSRTHDISNISYHLKDLDAFGDIVTKAATAAFPNRARSRYRHVYSLLLSWDEDELGVIAEVQELDDVLSQTYNFRTERWKIPSSSSHNALAFRLMEFVRDYDDDEHLLIVYYGGHGHMNDDRQCVWSWCVDPASYKYTTTVPAHPSEHPTEPYNR